MKNQISNFDSALFLNEYWQKKPVVLKRLFSDFKDPLDEHELAGLAQEEEVDSRIVRSDGNTWHVEHGPFDDFETVCQDKWSLLVQSVDAYLDDAQSLLTQFHFLPSWRIDDLMVSFSVAGAGVGPHLDQYDVFIIQGKGKRRWQVGMPAKYEETCPHKDLKHVTHFEPIIDEVLSPGDVIYIPPGAPHNGVALSECLNYSVGFRAPSQAELLGAFADYALDNEILTQRFTDSSVIQRPSPYHITSNDIERFKQLLKNAIDTDDFTDFMGSFLSNRHDHNNAMAEEYCDDDVNQNAYFIPACELNITVIEKSEQESVIYVNNQGFIAPTERIKELIEILKADCWQFLPENQNKNSLFFNQFMRKMILAGLWSPA
ncbi:cupin domain-containing protein [Aestuariibacter sp. AA17]|uniref:Cupin domain-containing protein n=1 Tax=Fluctibacter corallii TaxID=2984329 RepID=A0ABT3A5I4_9ALTE|nr:cupin domain-containing protein [Aestuariibacter sp. AA17]MCV2883895.1 cupin domain-containing protein [Aestuariibacter sp. AA17]